MITSLQRAYYAFLLIGGIAWALDLFLHLGFSLIEAEWLGPYLGVATAAAFASLFLLGITAGRFLAGFFADRVGC